MNTKYFFAFVFLMLAISLEAQDTIVLRDNLISRQKDGLYLISSHHKTNSFPLKNSKKRYATYPQGLNSKYFKSLLIDNDKIGIELTSIGKKKFNENFESSV